MDIKPIQTRPSSAADPRVHRVRYSHGSVMSNDQAQTTDDPRTLKQLVDTIQQTDRTLRTMYGPVGLRRFVAIFLLSLTTLLSSLAGAILIASRAEPRAVVQEQTTVVAGTSDTKLEEAPVTEQMLEQHGAPAQAPKFLAIPSIGLGTTRIFKVSSGENGNIEQPVNVADVGWYGDSTTPANQQGNVLLLGNVSGVFEEGAFYSLYRISIGDVIEVITGNDTIYRYRVYEKRELSSSEANIDDIIAPQQEGKATLTMLTYSGEFNPATQTYENRLVVFALRD